MGSAIKIATLNTRGVSQGWRWDLIWGACNINNIKILCLQEIHNFDMGNYIAQMKCKAVHSKGTSTQGGVALIVTTTFSDKVTIKGAFTIKGRVVSVYITYCKVRILYICVYAPPQGKECRPFFEKLRGLLTEPP